MLRLDGFEASSGVLATGGCRCPVDVIVGVVPAKVRKSGGVAANSA